MGIGEIKVKNLMSGKLETLLSEIETQVKNKNFKDLNKCVAELGKIGENIVIKNGVATVKATEGDVTEDIDFMAVLQQLQAKFNTGTVTKSDTERRALKNFRTNVENTVGTLLKENEITQELVSRGISDRDIIDNGETEIQRSADKVAKYKPILESHKQIRALFGEDSYIETAKMWDSKSYITQMNDAKVADTKLDEIKNKLTEMKNLADGLGSLSSADRTANEDEINKIWGEVEGLRDEIKALQISRLDLSELDRINKFDPANVTDKITKISTMKTVARTSKRNAITEMKNKIASNLNSFEKYIPTELDLNRNPVIDPNTGLPKQVDPSNLTEEQLQEIVKKLDEDIKKYANEIRYEETYQAKTRESVDRYKEAAEKARDLGAKYVERPKKVKIPKFQVASAREEVTNPDGTVTVTEKTDDDGNVLKAIYEFDENEGKYVVIKEFSEVLEDEELEDAVKEEIGEEWENEKVEVDSDEMEMVATDATRQDVLRANGIADENAYIEQAKNNARTSEETAISTLSTARKRELIRQAYRAEGGFHPIKFLRSQFAPSSMWENEYKAAYLAPRVASAEATAESTARAELDSKVGAAIETDLDELKRSTAVVTVARKYATEELAKAVSRNRVLYNVKNGTEVDSIKQSAVRAATVTGLSMEDLYIKLIDGEITGAEFDAQRNELNSKKDSTQARAYTDDVRNPQQYGKGHKDTFKDDEGR